MAQTGLVVVRLTRRLAVLGATGVGGGAALMLAGRTRGSRSFGQQTAAWGAIDLALDLQHARALKPRQHSWTPLSRRRERVHR